MTHVCRLLLVAASVAVFGCSAPGGDDWEDEDASEQASGVSGVVEKGTVLQVTASQLNLRNGPSTTHSILDVLAHGELVTCAAESGADGWVNVTTTGGEVGWVSGKFVVEVGNGGSGETCDPARAIGAVSSYQKALHDSIAYAEGTLDFAKDGYNVMFSQQLFSSCQSHPNKCIKFGKTCSTAAGRYQYVIDTWKAVRSAADLDTFEPENQERGAEYLIKTVRHVTVPKDRPMTASEFSNAMAKLSWEWAALPPGQYGQPNKTMSQMRAKYCSFAGC